MRKYLREKEDFPHNYVHVWKGVTPCLLCASVEVTTLLHAKKIPSEYLNNRKLLMSKMVHFENCPSGLVLTHNKFLLFKYSCVSISIVCVFEWVWLHVYCVQVSKSQVFHGERKNPSEYWHNRNLIMSKMVHFENGQFGLVLTHLQIPIVSIFMREYLREEEDFPENNVRDWKGVTLFLLCASFEVRGVSHAKKKTLWVFLKFIWQ